jgi:hypothetical protein
MYFLLNCGDTILLPPYRFAEAGYLFVSIRFIDEHIRGSRQEHAAHFDGSLVCVKRSTNDGEDRCAGWKSQIFQLAWGWHARLNFLYESGRRPTPQVSEPALAAGGAGFHALVASPRAGWLSRILDLRRGEARCGMT